MATAPSVTPVLSLGRPAISEGAAKDARATIGVLGNIRQRIEALERSLTNVNGVAVASSNASNTQINAIRQQIAQILQELAALEANANTDLVTLTAGEALSAQQAVVMSAQTTCVAFDPNDPERSTAIVGLTTTSANTGGSVVVRRRGFMLISDVFDAGRPVYATATGLSQLPSYDSVAGLVGRMLTTGLWIDPGVSALYLEDFDPGFEDFYPVTLGLVRRLLGDVSGDFVLYDSEGRAALTSSGGAIIATTGV